MNAAVKQKQDYIVDIFKELRNLAFLLRNDDKINNALLYESGIDLFTHLSARKLSYYSAFHKTQLFIQLKIHSLAFSMAFNQMSWSLLVHRVTDN